METKQKNAEKQLKDVQLALCDDNWTRSVESKIKSSRQNSELILAQEIKKVFASIVQESIVDTTSTAEVAVSVTNSQTSTGTVQNIKGRVI